MEEKIRTYKEKMDYSTDQEEVYKLTTAINNLKHKIIKSRPYLKEYIEQIPNAGIFVNNKLVDIIRELSGKLKGNNSIVYAAIKHELFSIAINDNLNDILNYEFDEIHETRQLQVIKKPTIWERIKRFINQRIFNVYLTEKDFEEIDEYIDKREEARYKLVNQATKRAEVINGIELDEETIKRTMLNYLEKCYFSKDFDLELFKRELSQELNELGMNDLTKEIDKKIAEHKTFEDRIKVDVPPREEHSNKEKPEEENKYKEGADRDI